MTQNPLSLSLCLSSCGGTLSPTTPFPFPFPFSLLPLLSVSLSSSSLFPSFRPPFFLFLGFRFFPPPPPPYGFRVRVTPLLLLEIATAGSPPRHIGSPVRMAAVAPAADQATELLQKLSLDSQNKAHEVPDVAKKPSGVPYAPVSNAEVASAPAPPPSDRSTTPVLPDFVDQTMCYVQNGYPSQAYYYGGYDGSVHEWEDYTRYDGMEGVYGDMYHGGYGYPPYGAYPGSPVPTMGHDGQLYGTQHYQYPGSYYQPSAPINSGPGPGPAPPAKPPTSQSEVSASVAADQPPLPGDSLKGNSNGITNVNGSNGTVPAKSNLKNTSLTTNGTYGRGAPPGGVPSGYHDPRFGYDGIRSPVSWLDGSIFPDGHNRLQSANTIPPSVAHVGNISSGQNQNIRPYPHMGSHPQVPASGMGPVGPGFMNRMYPNNRLYGQFGNVLRNGQGFGSNAFGFQSSGRGWMAMDNKYKVRGRGNGFYGYGNENLEGLNELNKGPRSGRFKTNQKSPGSNVIIAVKGQNLPSYAGNEDSSLVPDKDQFNRADFLVEYSDAKFFVIKSYSEDDIHKSVKYGVWASTPNGNKKLDAAYREAKEKANACPIFLFFSVNTSGQFVGVAEMVGPVDFNKTVDYWQQDKWNGCFPVKWHIVKDVPNSILKHIILENNENKPVTNSRDTQEVKLDQGIQMLKLFKEHVSKTSILDDFGFYEARQKTMQERRAKQQFQKQVWDGKAAPTLFDEKEKDAPNVKTRLQKPLESATTVENAASTESPKVLKSQTEKRVVTNGVIDNATTGC